MLDIALWTSFEKKLSTSDVGEIENRLIFLREILEDAIAQYGVEDVSGELDLNLHIYLKYFELSPDTRLSSWLIHDAWFNYYKDGEGLNKDLNLLLKEVFLGAEGDLFFEATKFLNCLDGENMIAKEADAVIWLSFLDYMASRMIFKIAKNRMKEIFNRKN